MREIKPKPKKYFSVKYSFYSEAEKWLSPWSYWIRIGYCNDYWEVAHKFMQGRFDCPKIANIRKIDVKGKIYYGVTAYTKRNTLTPIITLDIVEGKRYNSKLDKILNWLGFSVFPYEE